MSKAAWHYWLDVMLALSSLVLAVSSFLLWVVFPRGFFPARNLWVTIHKWVGLAVSVGALSHVLLHWRWLVRMTRHQWRRAKALLHRKRGIRHGVISTRD
jgi:hypothetical protein